MSETINTATSLGTAGRGGKKTSPPGIFVSLPTMAVDEWVEVDVKIETGLAAVGSLVSVIVPDDLPGDVLVGDPAVISPGKVRLRFCNNGLHRSPAREFFVHIRPYAKSEPRFPELTFDLPEGI